MASIVSSRIFALRRFSSLATGTFHARHSRVQAARSTFSTSSSRRASELSDIPTPAQSLVGAFRDSPIFQKIAQNPDVLAAAKELSDVMLKSGITVGVKPSPFMMMKLAMNPDYLRACEKVNEAFKEAGVDIESKEVMEEMTAIAKIMFSGK